MSASVQNYTGHENLSAMAEMGQYNQWIYDTVSPYLGSQLLEAGCGTGNLTSLFLSKQGLKRYVGVDLSPVFCETLKRSIQAPPRCSVEFHAMDLQDPKLMSLATPPFDSIICSNVLEHIPDDLTTLRRFHTMLEPAGRLILQVPAFQALYGSIDAVDQHCRRYSKLDLVRKVRSTGFVVKKAFYFNIFGIPAWIWHGKIQKLHTHPKEDLRAWDKWVPLLRKLESILPLPAGLSLFVVGEKPAAP